MAGAATTTAMLNVDGNSETLLFPCLFLLVLKVNGG
jgi:hypothetical protein